MLRAKNISKSYFLSDRRIDVLKSVSLEINSSDFVSIIGKSGSGKSTLLSILSGLDHPTEGELYFKGVRFDQLNEDELTQYRRKEIGFVFQSFHLIPSLNALENVMVPAQLAGNDKAREKAESLLESVGLMDRAKHFPRELSGGEQQRVSICRALVNDPAILFADEPTGNLDSTNEENVMNLLKSMRGRCALVMVTHDMQLARQAEKILEIRDGRVEAQDAVQAHA